MSKKLLPVILTFLALSALTVIPASAAYYDKPVVVAHLKGALEPDIQLNAIVGNLTSVEWRVVLGELTAADLSGAKMLVMSLSDSSQIYTEAELNAIKAWFDMGGKTIYVSADSDYGTDHMRLTACNTVLVKLNAKLRVDDCSAEDAVSNGGAPYRVLGTSVNADPEVEYLVRGVERGLFHGPGIVVGYEGGQMVDLTKDDVENVYIVMTTTETGIIVDNSEPTPGVMEAGVEGEFPLMAVEIDYAKKNMIIAAGEAPFDQYVGLYKPELIRMDRYGPEANTQQGATLFENIVAFATNFGEDILSLKSNVMGLETDVAGLEAGVADLETDVAMLTTEVNTLEGQVSTLTTEKAQLGTDLAAAQSSASTMQLAAVAALVIGVVIGYFVGPMLKKS
ncbi:hypothetical protein JXL21_14385 [Candidatus Bathyarchaeota archaeon]|nr:hypothetical protein [Candidatus Bathyarchaeota archaeon]